MLEKDIKKVTEGVYPFHMPGHKRQQEWLDRLYEVDVTEINGADNLHEPSGIIAEAQKRAARLYGTISTIFLTGGSTCGILSAISAVCKQGDGIIVARNCHKSVYNACLLNKLDAHFVYPVLKPRLGCFGEVLPADISTAMTESGAKVVVITSPTYEGILSDVKTIAQVVHKHKGILIVDSAHGAHLGFNKYFPESARALGADIVIESAHKTLPCLTGAAMLHLCSHRVSYGEIQNQLGLFETSSPPYPIICSIDRAVSRISAEDLFTPYTKRLDRLYSAVKELKHLSLFESAEFDQGKLVIFCGDSDINGFELKKFLLERYSIELEMAMPQYALAMTSIADTDEGFDRLFTALREIDKELSPCKNTALLLPPNAEKVMGLSASGEEMRLATAECIGKISAEFVYAYPPGSPIIAPGERFSDEILEYLCYLSASGAQIYSSRGLYPDFLSVLVEKD